MELWSYTHAGGAVLAGILGLVPWLLTRKEHRAAQRLRVLAAAFDIMIKAGGVERGELLDHETAKTVRRLALREHERLDASFESRRVRLLVGSIVALLTFLVLDTVVHEPPPNTTNGCSFADAQASTTSTPTSDGRGP